MKHCLCTLSLAAVLAFVAIVLPTPARAGVEHPFKCSICHKSIDQGEVVHKPVAAGTCLKCHEQFSGNHPLGPGSVGFIVPKEKLCAVCHGQLVQKQYLHPPVAQGKCTACHRPHTAQYKKLLKAPSPALCFTCHPQAQFTGTHSHPPVRAGECLSCHDPHGSDSRKLLKKPGVQLCFSCHDGRLAQGKSVHPPVARGECLGCHQPHASAYRRILKADLPEALYRPFSADAFPLCFSCHNAELAGAATTDKATNFRNGTRNLHAVHVNKAGKGRSCKICHNPHASTQDRLINPKSGFGSWAIPIRFQITPTGGGCTVGCHRPLRYDRLNAVVQ